MSADDAQVEALAEISQVIHDYLMAETDTTRPAFHATGLARRLADLIARERAAGAVHALREAADAYDALDPARRKGIGHDSRATSFMRDRADRLTEAGDGA